MHQYVTEIRAATVPLVREFDLEEVAVNEEPLRASVRLANEPVHVGIEFRVDWADLKVFGTVFRLKAGGEFVGLYDPDQVGEDRSAYSLDDLLLLRDPESRLPYRRLRRKAPGEARPILDSYVEAVCQRAADVLRGDFRVFEDLRRIVADRSTRQR